MQFFAVAFCFKPFVYVVGPAIIIQKVCLEKPGTMAQELWVRPKVQKQREEPCPSY